MHSSHTSYPEKKGKKIRKLYNEKTESFLFILFLWNS